MPFGRRKRRKICHEALLIIETPQVEKQSLVLNPPDHRHRQLAQRGGVPAVSGV